MILFVWLDNLITDLMISFAWLDDQTDLMIFFVRLDDQTERCRQLQLAMAKQQHKNKSTLQSKRLQDNVDKYIDI